MIYFVVVVLPVFLCQYMLGIMLIWQRSGAPPVPSIEWAPNPKTGWLLEWWPPAGRRRRTPEMSPGSILQRATC